MCVGIDNVGNHFSWRGHIALRQIIRRDSWFENKCLGGHLILGGQLILRHRRGSASLQYCIAFALYCGPTSPPISYPRNATACRSCFFFNSCGAGADAGMTPKKKPPSSSSKGTCCICCQSIADDTDESLFFAATCQQWLHCYCAGVSTKSYIYNVSPCAKCVCLSVICSLYTRVVVKRETEKKETKRKRNQHTHAFFHFR